MSSWMVTVGDYLPIRLAAPSKSKARWRAFLAFRRDVAEISFADFLARGVTVRIATEYEMQTLEEAHAT